MLPFTNYLPPHRPLCLCIGHDAPELGERNLRVTDIPGMLPLLRDTGAMFDLVSITSGILHTLTIAGILGDFVTPRGNLILLTDEIHFLPDVMRTKMWLNISKQERHWLLAFSHQHTGGCDVSDGAATDAWLTHRKGPVVDRMTACTDSEHRFIAATLEYEDRRNPNACEIDFKDAPLLTTLPPYHRYKRDIPNLHKHWVSLFHARNLSDIMAKPDDRAILRAIVASRQWRISPGALAAIQTAFSKHAAASAPLNAQNDAQRLAWLDECGSVKTRDLSEQPHTLDAVFKADEYPITTTLLETRTPSQRPGSDGEPEDITHEGTALAARVIDDLGSEHTFTSAPGYHTWQDFLAIFHPPEVPDIAALHPEDYAARRHWLVRFAASLSEPA